LSERLRVRPARDEDAAEAAPLLYLTSPGGFMLFGGGRRGGIRLIESAFRTPGTDNSREVVVLAELDERVVGAMALFPAAEGPERRGRFLRVALKRRPPWRWPRIVRVAREGASRAPIPPDDSLYIDALATAEDARRRGVARRLLEEAERMAREHGFGSLALDTTRGNEAARALYERFGFEIGEEVPAAPPIPAMVGYVKRLR
jgi:ribosomal protein S18 acetylase RimI-like enzyme